MDKEHYPEHEKLKEVRHKSQAIYDFLEWAREKDIYLVQSFYDEDEGVPFEGAPQQPVQQLLAEFFEIDLMKLEEEKQRMLDSIAL